MEAAQATGKFSIAFHALSHILNWWQRGADNRDAMSNRVAEAIVVHMLSGCDKDATWGLSIVYDFSSKGKQVADAGPLAKLTLDCSQLVFANDDVELMGKARVRGLSECVSGWIDVQSPLLSQGLVKLLHHEVFEPRP